MEDLWIVKNSGVDLDDFADLAVYRRFVRRFCREEELAHQRQLLYRATPEAEHDD